MAYRFRPVFQANLYGVWFVCDYVMVKDKFHGVLGLSKIEHCVPGQQNPEQNSKRGCAQISAHPCELVALTSDDHNFLVRTPICTFLDSTESSLSLEFNRINILAKTWRNIGVGHRKLRNGPFWFLELLVLESVCD